jgi:orotidine-5'-phosphate decarboxylase
MPGSNRRADCLIVALDVETAVEARVLIHLLGDSAGFYKVGLEMFAAAGMESSAS